MSSSVEEGETQFEKEEVAGGEGGEVDDESEGEDVPLASLRNDDNDPLLSGRKRRSVAYAGGGDDGEDDDSDDEDDVPLASLKKLPSKPKAKTKVPGPKKAKQVQKSPSKPSAGAKAGDYASASAALYESDSKKGLLIQKLLCRWWYAVTWPDPEALPDEPPKNYDELNGFEGIYVCTSGDKVGHILDLRGKDACPSFALFAKKSAKELKDLLLKALDKQMRELIEAEGEGTLTEKEIKEDIKQVKRIKADESDKEAVRVLKAAKMKV